MTRATSWHRLKLTATMEFIFGRPCGRSATGVSAGRKASSDATQSSEFSRIAMRAVANLDIFAFFVCQAQRVIVDEKWHRRYRAWPKAAEAFRAILLLKQLLAFARR